MHSDCMQSLLFAFRNISGRLPKGGNIKIYGILMYKFNISDLKCTNVQKRSANGNLKNLSKGFSQQQLIGP